MSYSDTDKQVLIGLLGGPSTGKSTLAEAIAESFGGDVVEEKLKWYWEENHKDRKLTKDQLTEVANLQIEAEDSCESQWVISDTTPITAEAYSFYYHDSSSKRLKRMSAECDRYDYLVLCDTDIPFEDDGVRSGDGTRQEIQDHTMKILNRENLDYVLVSGSVEDRIEGVEETIKSDRY